MSQVMDVDQNDNVLTMPFLKKKGKEDQPQFDSYEAVKEAIESLEDLQQDWPDEISRAEEGPVIDLTADLPLSKTEIREMSTVEVYLNLSQNVQSLNSLLSKMKYYLDELESIEKTVR